MTPLQEKAFKSFRRLWERDQLTRPRAHKYLKERFGPIPYFKTITDAQAQQIIDFTNPAAVVEYLRLKGKQSGICEACGRELTDPVSIARGIGPVCEGRFTAPRVEKLEDLLG